MNGAKFLIQLLKIICGFILGLVACGLFLAWGFFQTANPGDLYAEVQITLPKSLSPRAAELIQELDEQLAINPREKLRW